VFGKLNCRTVKMCFTANLPVRTGPEARNVFVLFVPQCDCRSFWLAPAFRIARTEAAPEAVQGQGSGTFAQSHGGGYASLRLRLQEIASFQR